MKAKGDSAATGHFFTLKDAHVLNGIKQDQGISVTLPDNDVIGSTHSGQLPTPKSLPQLATKTAVLPQLTSSSLISLPQLCDHGCEVLLTATNLHVVQDGTFILKNNTGQQVLHGSRNPLDGLWDIEIPQKPSVFPSRSSSSPTPSPINYHVNHVNMTTLNSTIQKFQEKDATMRKFHHANSNLPSQGSSVKF